MMKNNIKNNDGFAMIFTVLIITLVLNIAIGISNTSFKQNILSSMAKDSQAAFYQADSGMECALYYELNDPENPLFPRLKESDPMPNLRNTKLYCGDNSQSLNKILFFDYSRSYKNKYYFIASTALDNKNGCFEIIYDKTDPIKNIIQSNGFNSCSYSPRQVERTLKITY